MVFSKQNRAIFNAIVGNLEAKYQKYNRIAAVYTQNLKWIDILRRQANQSAHYSTTSSWIYSIHDLRSLNCYNDQHTGNRQTRIGSDQKRWILSTHWKGSNTMSTPAAPAVAQKQAKSCPSRSLRNPSDSLLIKDATLRLIYAKTSCEFLFAYKGTVSTVRRNERML